MLSNSISNLIRESIEMELIEAKAAGSLGFMARSLVMAAMPHRKIQSNEFTRINGRFQLKMLSPVDIGVPYGRNPRLILFFFCSQAVKYNSREIYCGKNISQFLDLVGIEKSGKPIAALKEQMHRLVNTTISYDSKINEKHVKGRFNIASKEIYFWDKNELNGDMPWASSIFLTEDFFQDIIQGHIPIDWRIIKSLKFSSLSLDIYVWLVYRTYKMEKIIEIPWERLYIQFGSSYSQLKDFKKEFLIQLNKVNLILNNINSIFPFKISSGKGGIRLNPISNKLLTYPQISVYK